MKKELDAWGRIIIRKGEKEYYLGIDSEKDCAHITVQMGENEGESMTCSAEKIFDLIDTFFKENF